MYQKVQERCYTFCFRILIPCPSSIFDLFEGVSKHRRVSVFDSFWNSLLDEDSFWESLRDLGRALKHYHEVLFGSLHP